jgi:hypothetical protein
MAFKLGGRARNNILTAVPDTGHSRVAPWGRDEPMNRSSIHERLQAATGEGHSLGLSCVHEHARSPGQVDAARHRFPQAQRTLRTALTTLKESKDFKPENTAHNVLPSELTHLEGMRRLKKSPAVSALKLPQFS